jgi:hypothetical protein
MTQAGGSAREVARPAILFDDLLHLIEQERP